MTYYVSSGTLNYTAPQYLSDRLQYVADLPSRRRGRCARRLNLPVLGVFRDFTVVGVPPDIMGIGPVYAIPEVLRRNGKLLFLLYCE